MIKLENWNAWCNDKIVLHNIEDLTCLINLNTVLHLEETPDKTTIVSCTDGVEFEVKESIKDILALVGEIVEESEARRKEAEEAQRAAYAEQMKQYQAQQAAQEKTSEG